MRKGRMMLLVVACIVVVAIIVGALIYIDLEKDKLITAIEGRHTADIVAKEWHKDAKLIAVGCMESTDDNGRSSKWYYEYYSPNTSIVDGNETRYEHAFVYVSSDGDEIIEVVSPLIVNPTIGVVVKAIGNWTIDSDKAVEIAKKNSQIKAFLSKYNDAQVGLTLHMDEEYLNNIAIWSISWSDQGFMDNPHNARIIINASTGEILNVETQM